MGRLLFRMVGVLLVVGAIAALTTAAVSAQSRVQYVPVKQIASPLGADVYDTYCASCHGPSGKGNGPAVRAVEVPVPDLTLIVLRDGKFVPEHVISHIRWNGDAAPMPKWHRVLADAYAANGMEPIVYCNLARHLEGMQVTPTR